MARTVIDQDDPDGVLRELAELVRSRVALERQEATLVRKARNQGIVWEQIAASLAVSKQAVHKKHRSGRRL
ncbi:MAG: hypothetical protein ABIP36_09260 [Acidimicrobiales bacterium]